MAKTDNYIINKLVVSGNGLEDAVIKFSKGVNVIYGASNTGKSYIFSLINFMLGGNETPPSIDEAKGYEFIYMELKTANKYVTLERSLYDGKTACYYSEYSNLSKELKKSFSKNHTTKPNNISKMMLNNIGATYEKNLKSKDGKKQNFTFRSYTGLTLLSETAIVNRKSIIREAAGGYQKTASVSAFETIVTGSDYIHSAVDDSSKIDINSIEIELNLLEEELKTYRSDYEKIVSNSVFENEIDVSNEINILLEDIERDKEFLSELQQEKKEFSNKEEKHKEELNYYLKLEKKFKLLQSNYQSDYSRIDFIGETRYYFDQLDNVICPICGIQSKPKGQIESSDDFLKIISIEKKDIENKMSDLEVTINILQEKTALLLETQDKNQAQIFLLENTISELSSNEIEKKLERLQKRLIDRDKLNQGKYIDNKIADKTVRKEELLKKKENGSKVSTSKNNTRLTMAIRESICEIVSELLTKWKLFESAKVSFDIEDNYDLIINGKAKNSFGKGYAAIINSALSIAIMLYCRRNDLPYPKILVLDSPLLSFDGKRKNDIGEKVPDELKISFFKYLNEIIKEEQIIIIENLRTAQQELNTIKGLKLNFFTNGEEEGRVGFFPNRS
ncbi:hypothetical protein ACWN8P_03030 [Vagococcus salmoninarum]|uniref:Rad50/SbcC-type AAA domain-containing protein n=1 Tax=Vagococcus salmoninarum TaxID=2739 RepID=A0A429ZTW2_9ENTE|nr:hypothetical protein [Vagococcus salmoninarum]RST97170.1 hypothetical protein CBF35_02660 [Vagococcus salmoninarum]